MSSYFSFTFLKSSSLSVSASSIVLDVTFSPSLTFYVIVAPNNFATLPISLPLNPLLISHHPSHVHLFFLLRLNFMCKSSPYSFCSLSFPYPAQGSKKNSFYIFLSLLPYLYPLGFPVGEMSSAWIQTT